ncbi:VanZ family protein [Actinokineospora sp. PR83]|uniref:VanZ family protein n=1 Tax=Actinokineospora sp. PR83 TaxID=2884908 RepID=UPI0027E00167|nr:VanZ family protein [Actinokineospora sp. PR83]MCG8919121.1 VanZ family protein [Actinokineospora sp. PR83]
MFREVPVLPVVVPVAAAVFLILLWYLHSRDRLSAPRAAVALALCVYAAGVVANTVFPIFLDKPARSALWKVYLVPFANYEVGDAVTNILVFVPIGVLVPLLVAKAPWWRVVAVAAAFSLVIELTQLVTRNLLGGGHVADVNDLIFNTAGGALGFGLCSALSRVPAAAALIDRFRWR